MRSNFEGIVSEGKFSEVFFEVKKNEVILLRYFLTKLKFKFKMKIEFEHEIKLKLN